ASCVSCIYHSTITYLILSYFYILSLHDALPIYFANSFLLSLCGLLPSIVTSPVDASSIVAIMFNKVVFPLPDGPIIQTNSPSSRSEEHTSELKSRFDLVCSLLLEKKNTLGNINI